MYSIDTKKARDIVNRVMKIISYNINIMNRDGVIIASGDPTRLNKIHSGAKSVIESKSNIEIYKDTEKEKSGINLPIIYCDEVIGVIGITGKPDEIRQFGELVKMTAELLVNEHFIMSHKKNIQISKNKFLYELIQRKGDYSEENLSVSSKLGINLNIDRIALAINVKDKDFNYIVNIKEEIVRYLEDQEFVFEYDENTILVLVNTISRQNIIINVLSKEKLTIGVGMKSKNIATTFKQAKLAMESGNIIYKDLKVLKYEELYFLSTLTTCEGNSILENHVKVLKEEGSKLSLIETILAYVEYNGEVNTISKKLNIHRNTLNYRLEKIYLITGKNPKNILDLLELYTAYILYN